jgi:hypothetical protein
LLLMTASGQHAKIGGFQFMSAWLRSPEERMGPWGTPNALRRAVRVRDRADPQEIDDADLQEIDDKCKVWRAQEIAWRAKKKEAIWAWLTAGAIGAMGTAIGVPIATRRIFSFASFLSTTFAGAVIAGLWYAITLQPDPWNSEAMATCLFVAWQAVVAAVIGQSIR